MIAIFRLCAQLPLFGIDAHNFANLAATNNLIGFLDMFSGGALGNVSIIALGIGPYITATIIIGNPDTLSLKGPALIDIKSRT